MKSNHFDSRAPQENEIEEKSLSSEKYRSDVQNNLLKKTEKAQ
tara:strand:- start:1021 stop:1149 length:129 start_codon:yes stop_codon:yes gene_type:complete